MRVSIVFLGFAGLMFAVRVWAECAAQSRYDDLSSRFRSYTPPAAAVSSGGGSQQTSSQGNQQANMQNAAAAMAACSQTLGGMSDEAKNLEKELEGEACASVKRRLKDTKKQIDTKKGQCDSAGSAAQKNADKAGDNKEKGGGGGGAPQMPQIPQQKDDKKKDDSLQKEQARQAKIAACKAQVNAMLTAQQSACEVKFGYDVSHPIPAQKQRQDECKQNAIFQSQSNLTMCDSAYPPGTDGSGPMPSFPSANTGISGGETVTSYSTSTATSRSTSTATSSVTR